MWSLSEIRKIKADEYALIYGFVFSIAIPGLLAVYLHREDLFITLEIYKLLLLSAAFTIPIILLNSIVLFVSELDNDSNDNLLIDSMAISCLIFYPALLISFIFDIDYKGHIGIAVLCQVVVLYLIYIMRKHEGNAP